MDTNFWVIESKINGSYYFTHCLFGAGESLNNHYSNHRYRIIRKGMTIIEARILKHTLNKLKGK